MSAARETTYWDYIRVEELLALQSGLEGDERQLADEEVLFITVHQVYELWFKLVLRSLVSARDPFRGAHVAEQELSSVVARLRRAVTIFRMCAQHFEVIETLSTRDYLRFRNKLMPASGFQSAQLRQIELVMGLEEAQRLPFGGEGGHLAALRYRDGRESPALARVEGQLDDRPSLREAIDDWLYRTPIDGSSPDEPDAAERLAAFVEEFAAAHDREVDEALARALELARDVEEARAAREAYARERDALRSFLSPPPAEGGARRGRIRAALLFIQTYRELPLLAWPRELLDGLLELEQAFLIFRQRHARMVERVIGRRTGTGGTSGVEYLDQTALRYRVFTDLWAVRTLMIRRDAAPQLADPGFYGFRSTEG